MRLKFRLALVAAILTGSVHSHIVFASQPPTQDVPEEALLKRTRRTCQGPLVIGHDLMSFVIADKVEAFAPDGAALT